jgi:hypothetical protein
MRKYIIGSSVAIVGAVAFLGYKVVKEINKLVDDINWDDLGDSYYSRQSKNADE